MALSKNPHDIYLPAEGVNVDLYKIPSYYFLRIHMPTGHVYLDHYNDSHGVSTHDFERQTPNRVDALRLEELVRKWNVHGAGTWAYESCSLGDVNEIMRAQKALSQLDNVK